MADTGAESRFLSGTPNGKHMPVNASGLTFRSSERGGRSCFKFEIVAAPAERGVRQIQKPGVVEEVKGAEILLYEA